jgi:hypothetical protein
MNRVGAVTALAIKTETPVVLTEPSHASKAAYTSPTTGIGHHDEISWYHARDVRAEFLDDANTFMAEH